MNLVSLIPFLAIPAKAGTHRGPGFGLHRVGSEQMEKWVPAFAGMTVK